jgi:hypothetical protein
VLFAQVAYGAQAPTLAPFDKILYGYALDPTRLAVNDPFLGRNLWQITVSGPG